MQGMSVIVKKIAQLMSGLIFVYGAYIITHGHLTPGGGFAGGALVAGAFILLILANGSEYIKLKRQEEGSSVVESAAVLVALLLATMGLLAGTMFFFNNYLPAGIPGRLISGGLIPVYNIFIGTEVAAALITIFLALVIYKEEISK
jgi:multisubunit Na+/H+ antiporter MnhB subunit